MFQPEPLPASLQVLRCEPQPYEPLSIREDLLDYYYYYSWVQLVRKVNIVDGGNQKSLLLKV